MESWTLMAGTIMVVPSGEEFRCPQQAECLPVAMEGRRVADEVHAEHVDALHEDHPPGHAWGVSTLTDDTF